MDIHTAAEIVYGPDALGLTEQDFEHYSYYVCADCGHIETRQAVVESPMRCEHCHRCSAFWACDDLASAEDESQSILDRGDPA